MSNTQLSIVRPADRSTTFVDDNRRSQRNRLVVGILLTLLLGALYIVANGNIAAPIALVVLVGIVILLWNSPEMLLPLTVAGSCLFETFLFNFSDSLTDRVPLFWDVNTVFQVYAHANVHVMPLSLFEVILIIGASFALIRGVYNRTFTLKGGALIAPISAYMVCVVFGIVHGLASGGDYHIALFEVRAQFYILFAYIIALNSGREPRDVAKSTVWIAAICIGLKGLLLTFRYFVTMKGSTTPEVGVGAHEESFFFNEFVMLYFVLKMADLEPVLRRCMLFMLPFVLIANLANERRAATAAMMIAIPMLLVLCFVAFPRRRKLIGGLVVAIAVLLAVYLPAFWNSDGVLGQPARAIRSNSDPSARDQSSDIYRIAEDGNLMATMRTSPIIGYGYGKPILNVTGMVDVSNFDPLVMYLTHDQILWVWMRLGTIGFVVFWIMIANILICASRLAADARFDSWGRASGVFVATTVASLLLFGLYDLQLSNVRDMLFSSVWIGILGAVLRQRAEQEEAAKVRRMAAMQRYLHPRSIGSPGYTYMPSRVRTAGGSTELARLKRAGRQ